MTLTRPSLTAPFGFGLRDVISIPDLGFATSHTPGPIGGRAVQVRWLRVPMPLPGRRLMLSLGTPVAG
jgi:hypothetical protein